MSGTCAKGGFDDSRHRLLIWYVRGSDKALRTIEQLDGFSISMSPYIELVQGLRSKMELNTLKNFLRSRSVAVCISPKAFPQPPCFLVEQHHFGHALVLSDALIAPRP